MKPITQTFNDGVVNIYSVGNIALSGNMPKEGLTLKVGHLRYKEKTVGMSRYWIAKQAQAKIDMVIRVPKILAISVQDIAIPIDGNQYRIVQIQHIEDMEPPVMDLSLQRLEADYEDWRRIMKLADLRDALLTINPHVFHYFANCTGATPDNYIVWAEDGQGNSAYADNCMIQQTITGTIDYFTKTEFDPKVGDIQEKLNSIDIAWSLESVQYEEDTGYIHYEWSWEMVVNG